MKPFGPPIQDHGWGDTDCAVFCETAVTMSSFHPTERSKKLESAVASDCTEQANDTPD